MGKNLVQKIFETHQAGGSLKTGEQIGPAAPPIEDGSAFDRLLETYETQVEHSVDMLSRVRERFDTFQSTLEAVPFCSALIGDCVQRGRDAYDGGARHKWGGVYCVGPATTADSLLVMKRILQGGAPAGRAVSGLLDALRSDFREDRVLHKWVTGLSPSSCATPSSAGAGPTAAACCPCSPRTPSTSWRAA